MRAKRKTNGQLVYCLEYPEAASFWHHGRTIPSALANMDKNLFLYAQSFSLGSLRSESVAQPSNVGKRPS